MRVPLLMRRSSAQYSRLVDEAHSVMNSHTPAYLDHSDDSLRRPISHQEIDLNGNVRSSSFFEDGSRVTGATVNDSNCHSDSSSDEDDLSTSRIQMGEESSSVFSVPLVEESKHHIRFLRALHSLGVTLRRQRQESFRRYSDLWLPLVAHFYCRHTKDIGDEEHDEVQGLVPPPDIAWLWHCHRLAPYKYAEHVNQRFGIGEGMLKAGPAFALQYDARQQIGKVLPDEHEGRIYAVGLSTSPRNRSPAMVDLTRKIWEELYPTEPFFLNPSTSLGRSGLPIVSSVAEGGDYWTDDEEDHYDGNRCSFVPMRTRCRRSRLGGYDVVAAAERHASYLWHVSDDKFRSDDDYLNDGVQSYHRFLLLLPVLGSQRDMGMNRCNNSIIPTYQIDLIWKTHILSSIPTYTSDCRRVIGRAVYHFDGDEELEESDEVVAGRSPLEGAFMQTLKLWKEEYGEELVTLSAGRGEPPAAYWDAPWALECPDFSHDEDEGIEVSTSHLIGNVAATSWTDIRPQVDAFSSVPTISVLDELPKEWLSSHYGVAPDGKPAFIPAEDVVNGKAWGKRKKRKVPNPWKKNKLKSGVLKSSSSEETDAFYPQMEDYVFGKGPSRGVGYYHRLTRDACIIMANQLRSRIISDRCRMYSVIGATVMMPFLATCTYRDIKRSSEELSRLREVHDVVRARSRADRPEGGFAV